MVYRTRCFFIASPDSICSVVISNSDQILFHSYGNNCEEQGCRSSNGNIYEVRIEASDQQIAQTIAELLCASYTVVSGSYTFDTQDLVDQVCQEEVKDSLNFVRKTRSVIVYGNEWCDAAKLVAAVFSDIKHRNAICKYHTACEMLDLCFLKIDPLEDASTHEYLLTEKVRISNAVVACYSILEELNLHAPKGELLNNRRDGWAKWAYRELSERLQKAGISPQERIPWRYRNNENTPYSSAIDQSLLCEWSDGKNIKDYKIKVIEAIFELKRLRNKIGAHDMGERVQQLSIYNAANAFFLTYELILSFFNIKRSYAGRDLVTRM